MKRYSLLLAVVHQDVNALEQFSCLQDGDMLEQYVSYNSGIRDVLQLSEHKMHLITYTKISPSSSSSHILQKRNNT
jgi:hypothetical protein